MPAITHDTTVTANVYDQVSLTFEVTVDNQTNRILIVTIANGFISGAYATDVTYAGDPLSMRAQTSEGNFARLETWYLRMPAIGPNNVVITWPSNARAAVTASSYYNVASKAGPTMQVAQGGLDTPPETEVLPLAGGEADFLTVCAHSAHGADPTLTLLNGQTARSNHLQAAGGPFSIRLATDDRAYALSPQRYLASNYAAWVSHGCFIPALAVSHQGRLTSHSPTSGICAGRFPIEQRVYVGEGGRYGPYATVVFGDVEEIDLDLVTLKGNTWYEVKVLPGRDGVEGDIDLYRARFRTDGAGDPVPAPNLVTQVLLTPQAGGDVLVEWAYQPLYATQPPEVFDLRYDFDNSGPFDHAKIADVTEDHGDYTLGKRRFSKTIAAVGTPRRIRVSIRARGLLEPVYDNYDLRVWTCALAPTGPEKLTESLVLALVGD